MHPEPYVSLAEAASLRDTSMRRSCSPSNREESNDGTHETKPVLLRRRRMGPQPGEGVHSCREYA